MRMGSASRLQNESERRLRGLGAPRERPVFAYVGMPPVYRDAAERCV